MKNAQQSFGWVHRSLWICLTGVSAAVGLVGCSDDRMQSSIEGSTATVSNAAPAAEIVEVQWASIQLGSIKNQRLKEGLVSIQAQNAAKAAEHLIRDIGGNCCDPTEEELAEQEQFDAELDKLIAQQPMLGLVIGDLLRSAGLANGVEWYRISEKHGSQLAVARIQQVLAAQEQQLASEIKAQEDQRVADVAVAPAPVATPAPVSPTRPAVNVGATICASLGSLTKASIIERSGNTLVDPPDDCIVAQRVTFITITRSFYSNASGSEVHQLNVNNQVVYVRDGDISHYR